MDTYKKILAENLKCNEQDLTPILSPDEFKDLIFKFKPENFSVGSPLSSDNKIFFQNVTKGDFRVTLHNHSFFSDGRMSPAEFIEMAVNYANKVAKIHKNEEIPPFTIALTDHDEVRGSIEVLKLISQNSQKFENLRFVCGAELSSELDGKYFDVTALCVNPFDKNLTDYLDALKDLRTVTAKKYISLVNALDDSDFTLESFVPLDFNKKRVLKNRSGVVYLNHVKKILLTKYIEKYGENNKYLKEIKSLYNKENIEDIDTQNIVKILSILRAEGALSSWTHPARTFKHINSLDWHEDFFLKLKSLGVNGVEANQQYTFKHYTEDIKFLKEKNELYCTLAQKNKMFLSGGTDSHEYNIFAHHQQIDEKLLKTFFENS